VIRQATDQDRKALHALYEGFFAELPPMAHYLSVSLENELAAADEIVGEGLAFVAEEDGEVAGFALGRRREGTRGVLTDLYVRPESRRRGHASELTRAVVDALEERGATHIQLMVEVENAAARAVYDRWGFKERMLTLDTSVGELKQRLAEQRDSAPSFGSVHVQTDDVNAVARAACEFVARLPGQSEGTIVSQPRNGWVAVYDELCDREPPLLQRVARELSDRMGGVVLTIGLERGEAVRYNLYERGRSVDEYLSLPEYYGPLPSGDAVALGANPTVVARLTGADRARFRGVARTGSSPDELPPAPELLASIASEMRIEGATHGFAGAEDLPGAVRC
jgi:ribosomal protein S18 acetylase RimI-like enzyme